MTDISANDRELMHQLLEDAALIATELAAGLPKPAKVRSTFAPILRKWIVEDCYFKAAKLIRPYQPAFEIMTVPNAVKHCKAGIYEHWMAMIFFKGLGVGTSLPVKKHQGKAIFDGNPIQAKHPAKIFFEQKMFFWKEKFYTRRDVTWMHANRLGGVHLDFRRKHDEQHIDEIRRYFGYEVFPNNIQMMQGNSIEIARADINRRDRVFDATELVAIDTARIFADGVLSAKHEFERVLTQPA